MNCSTKLIKVGARGSPLSRAQMQEVLEELRLHHSQIAFQPIWVETTGDKDLKTSLKSLEKTNFFTKEIDELQLLGFCRISIHSAKDLPNPCQKVSNMIALTKGVDPSDSIVLRDGMTLENLPQWGKNWHIVVRDGKKILRSCAVTLSASISAAISVSAWRLLDEGLFDGVVMAEAALIRLNLTCATAVPLPGESAQLQGQLAVLALEEDEEMRALFECIDTRKR